MILARSAHKLRLTISDATAETALGMVRVELTAVGEPSWTTPSSLPHPNHPLTSHVTSPSATPSTSTGSLGGTESKSAWNVDLAESDRVVDHVEREGMYMIEG